ncbi:MAG: amino acid permease [Verrucomicrobiota bacterium]|nr:amino acid permease [Verrucomicrobiota bacterium]
MPRKTLTIWMIALINIAAVCNIKNFPLLSEYGFSILFFLSLAALFFFLPVSFVSAELASTWPDRGVYTWVKEAFGPKWGFLAIWLQWIENVIWYPTVLSFIAATFAYMIDPALATNKFYILTTILITFWSVTWINFLGMRVSGWISSLSAFLGTLLPIALIILLGLWWIASGHPVSIDFSFHKFFPNLSSLNQLVLLSGVLFSLAGMEMSAVHARDVEHPRRDYPRAIFLSATLILLFSALGALAIAAIIPGDHIELASGGMAAFEILFQTLGMPWAVPLIAGVTTFGALGMMSTWIVGPSRGLLATAEDGELPPFFHKVNSNHMPVNILITQAIIVSALSLVFLFMPSVNSSYWILVALASLLYMIMYILMFLAALRLRYKKPHIPRLYQVPGGLPGLWILCLIGIAGSAFGFVISFFPPSQLDTGAILPFETFLIGAAILFCGLPFLIYRCRKPAWKRKN